MENNKVKGVVFILASSVIYSGMSCLIKYAFELGAFRMVLGRFLVGLIVLSALWVSGKRPLRFTNKKLLTIRGVLGGAIILITVLSILKIGVGKSTVILNSYPIYASIFGVVLLKEKLRVLNFAALGLAVVGLYFLVAGNNGFEDGFGIGLFEIIAIGGSIIAGLAVCTIRKLHETETSFEIFYAQCFCGTLMVIVPAITTGGSISIHGLLILLGIGCCAVSGQLLMTEGFRYLDVKTASVLAMSELITSYILGIALFSEVVSVRAVVGAVLIAVGCVMAVSGPVRVVRKAR